MRRGIATFGLDHGRCPPWLFERMVRLARSIAILMVENFGPETFLETFRSSLVSIIWDSFSF